jgi:hypothetical protein
MTARLAFVRAWLLPALPWLLISAAQAAEPPASGASAVITRVEKAVERGADAAASGIKRGARAAASGVAKGTQAAASGVAAGARATARAADRVADKVSGKASSPTP